MSNNRHIKEAAKFLVRTYGGDQRKFARFLRKGDMVVCGNANWWIDIDDDYQGVVLRSGTSCFGLFNKSGDKRMSNNTKAFVAAARLHALAMVAAKNGGFWVSFAGGTANVAAGIIAKATGVTFDQAFHALDIMGKDLLADDWYSIWAFAQPWRYDDMDSAQDARFDIRTIARAAVKGIL